MSSVRLAATWTRAFRRRLFGWYDRHARQLPWRGTRDPYRIWVSEIMLQQTQVSTVIPYFERFVAAFPHVHALAGASEQEVLCFWEGLGYYRRARQMHRAARLVVDRYHGEFPTDLLEMRSLPGIGRYTAGAILSFAHDARHPILEANTVRLYSRLMAYAGDTGRAGGQRQLWDFAAAILPRTRVGTFNQALMELGATVCTPRDPACGECPVANLCLARAQGLQHRLPARARKTAYENALEGCAVVRKGDQVLVRRCAAGERWAGLWDFPRFPLTPPEHDYHQQLVTHVHRITGLTVEPLGRLATIKHGVTRFRITLECFDGRWRGGQANRDGLRWIAPDGLTELPLSRTARKIARLLLEGADRSGTRA